MIIPNKHSGYQAGIRLYPGDGGAPDAGPASGTDAGAGLTGASPPSGFADSNAGESSSLGTYYGGQFGAGPAPNLGANPSNADVGINYGEGVSAPQGTGVGGYASPGPSGFFGSGYDGLFGPSSNSYLGTTINSGGGSFDSGGGVGGNIPAIVNRPTRQTGYGSPTYNTQPIYRQPIYRGPTSRNYFNPAQQFNNNTSVYGTGRQYSNPYQPQQQYNPYQPQQQYNPYQPQQQYNPYQQQQQYNPYQPQQQYNPYPPQQQYNPYQMQSPFSYQPQQRYNPYQQPQQSRRSPMGGRRYAEGGIAGILKK